MISINGVQRTVTSILMFGAFVGIASFGTPGIVLLIAAIEGKVYQELNSLQPRWGTGKEMRRQRFLDWFLFVTCSGWVWGELFFDRFLSWHRLISALAYSTWLCLVVVTFQLKHIQAQINHFCWSHTITLFTAAQTYFFATSVHHGLIWFLLPSLTVVCNDCAAYIFGRYFGRTSLSALSPNKTVEGFVGGAMVTLLCGYFLGHYLSKVNYLIEPYPTPFWQGVHVEQDQPKWTAMEWHGVIFGLFASTIAPFGGLLASAAKRSCGLKDFGTLIPGHGGMTDRMDCQLLVGLFSFVYRNWAMQHMY